MVVAQARATEYTPSEEAALAQIHTVQIDMLLLRCLDAFFLSHISLCRRYMYHILCQTVEFSTSVSTILLLVGAGVLWSMVAAAIAAACLPIDWFVTNASTPMTIFTRSVHKTWRVWDIFERTAYRYTSAHIVPTIFSLADEIIYIFCCLLAMGIVGLSLYPASARWSYFFAYLLTGLRSTWTVNTGDWTRNRMERTVDTSRDATRRNQIYVFVFPSISQIEWSRHSAHGRLSAADCCFFLRVCSVCNRFLWPCIHSHARNIFTIFKMIFYSIIGRALLC